MRPITLFTILVAVLLSGVAAGTPALPAGMDNYFVVFKTRGPKFATVQTPEAHWVHLKKLVEAGKVVALGPLTDDGEIRGVSVFKTDTMAEAVALAEADPAVQAGRFAVEAHPWTGPAGIGAQFATEARKYASLPETPMTTYYFGLLKAGPTWTTQSTPKTERLQAAHLAHIERMAESQQLVAAGPFTDGGNLAGILVFQVSSIAEAKALADADPAVEAGRLVIELHPWMVTRGVFPPGMISGW